MRASKLVVKAVRTWAAALAWAALLPGTPARAADAPPAAPAAATSALPAVYTETVTNKTGEKVSFEMRLIPAGRFTMGSPAAEPNRREDEGPAREVEIAPFYLCPTETTIELFLAYYHETVTGKPLHGSSDEKKEEPPAAVEVDVITGPTAIYGDITLGYSKRHPAMGVSWLNAATFCKWLAKKTGKQYRLPTEAEWEYACRAGAKTAFSFGDDPKAAGDYAWFESNSDGKLKEVGTKKPNAWGLYDMSGNVLEWVQDFYSPTAYADSAKGAAVNPIGPATGKVHVARGGAYDGEAGDLRCAARSFEESWWHSGDPQYPKSIWWLPSMDWIGFRIARSVPAGGERQAPATPAK